MFDVDVRQEPEGQSLMLDRFDVRWMLDVADLNKGSSTLNRASSLTAEVSVETSCILDNDSCGRVDG